MANPDISGKTQGIGAEARDDATADVNAGERNGGAASSGKTGLTRSQHYLVIGLLAVVLLLVGIWFQAGPRAPIPPGDDVSVSIASLLARAWTALTSQPKTKPATLPPSASV